MTAAAINITGEQLKAVLDLNLSLDRYVKVRTRLKVTHQLAIKAVSIDGLDLRTYFRAIQRLNIAHERVMRLASEGLTRRLDDFIALVTHHQTTDDEAIELLRTATSYRDYARAYSVGATHATILKVVESGVKLKDFTAYVEYLSTTTDETIAACRAQIPWFRYRSALGCGASHDEVVEVATLFGPEAIHDYIDHRSGGPEKAEVCSHTEALLRLKS